MCHEAVYFEGYMHMNDNVLLIYLNKSIDIQTSMKRCDNKIQPSLKLFLENLTHFHTWINSQANITYISLITPFTIYHFTRRENP